MNKKIIGILSMWLALSSCGWNGNVGVPKEGVPIRAKTVSPEKTSTGLTNDLNEIIEQAYRNASSSKTGSGTATGRIVPINTTPAP